MSNLLTQIAERYPDIIRIVLTGYSDVEPMLHAINRARAWRFLIKPYGSGRVARRRNRSSSRAKQSRPAAAPDRATTEHRDALNDALRELKHAQSSFCPPNGLQP